MDPAGGMMPFRNRAWRDTSSTRCHSRLALRYYGIFDHSRIRIDARAALAFTIYALCAVTAMVANSWFGFDAVRDFAIISSYLLLLVFWFRAPDSFIDMALATLAVCLVTEPATTPQAG